MERRTGGRKFQKAKNGRLETEGKRGGRPSFDEIGRTGAGRSDVDGGTEGGDV